MNSLFCVNLNFHGHKTEFSSKSPKIEIISERLYELKSTIGSVTAMVLVLCYAIHELLLKHHKSPHPISSFLGGVS